MWLVISEIEFASYFCSAKKICVTGTNGKTTTTLMVSYILKKAGLKVKAVGNIGESYALSVALEKFDYYVIELSSFQLDRMFDFKADISILLNISPDHLDRYQGDFIKYSKSKFRINQNMTMDDHLIYNYDDQVISSWISSKNKRLHQNYPVSIYEKLEKGARLENEQIQININKKNDAIENPLRIVREDALGKNFVNLMTEDNKEGVYLTSKANTIYLILWLQE